MFRIVIFTCVLQVTVCIIVTDPPPTSTDYNYWYNIIDPSTGDTKSAQEIRHDGIVKGSYSVVDPDGMKRTVDYTAGGSQGFQAIVRNEPVTKVNQAKQKHYNLPGQEPYPARQGSRKQAQTPLLSANKFVKSTVYFTPGNDTPSERGNFNRGEFFLPNYMNN